jgi:hypothetical protein
MPVNLPYKKRLYSFSISEMHYEKGKSYGCKDICSAPTVLIDLLEWIVKEYISNLLSEAVQLKLA